ncbi:MAG TPA: hypothetical protein VHU79_01810, partial [Sphingomicrobium sp.]|nr:hypothetical protein [Sphingomicrobium sp.]
KALWAGTGSSFHVDPVNERYVPTYRDLLQRGRARSAHSKWYSTHHLSSAVVVATIVDRAER